ncbi:hypothetical protein K3495_g15609 [Podosphaera aphanis]|nr:hypothetical protein K3495_g15609 [Podosphaera aphanis]
MAIADYKSGKYKSQRAAAKQYSIPFSTVRDRLHGVPDISARNQNQQRLSPEQERFIVEWNIEEDTRDGPPSHPRVREMASRILEANGDRNPLGKIWIPHFLKRNPRVASMVSSKIEAVRAKAADPQQLRAFIEKFEHTRKRLNVATEDIYNMDETGLALGVCTNTILIASSSKKKKAFVKSPENREWVSIIGCVSAARRKLRCAAIFKGKSLQTTWPRIHS